MKIRNTFISVFTLILVLFTMIDSSYEEPVARRITEYNLSSIFIEGSNQLEYNAFPDYIHEAWQDINPYTQAALYGQCTWFVWARFYEIYGYSPDFLGNGNECVEQLLEHHNDTFIQASTPIVGSIGSSDTDHNHVWIVVGIDEDGSGCTIQEGNLDDMTNVWADSLTDWRQKHYSWQEIYLTYGNAIYANPK